MIKPIVEIYPSNLIEFPIQIMVTKWKEANGETGCN